MIKLNACSNNLDGCSNVGLGVIARVASEKVVQMWLVTREGNLNPVVADLDYIRVAMLVA